jgi:hypothetical protein
MPGAHKRDAAHQPVREAHGRSTRRVTLGALIVAVSMATASDPTPMRRMHLTAVKREGPEPPAPAAAPPPAPPAAARGIGLFPPPGTNPPKPGIIVPDNFELPPGYVRHNQTMDDGRELPPILMFHPDYDFLDEHGQRVAIPTDRVVPPEMAPAGLPIRMLVVPETIYPTPPRQGLGR